MKEDLRRFIVDSFLYGQALEFSDDDSLQETGIVDSTGILELLAHVERRYGVRIEDEELLPENFDSINRLSRFLEAKLARPAAAADRAC